MNNQDYWLSISETTDLSKFSNFIDWLSPDVRVLFQCAQGLIVHSSWLDRYGIQEDERQLIGKSAPTASEMLSFVQKMGDESLSLSVPRALTDRMIGCCRDYTVLLTAFLRAKGIPARSRCGFAKYLANEGFFEDHWVSEYWNGKKWVMVDAQIDPFQQSLIYDYAKTHKPISKEYRDMFFSLNPLDVSNEHFVNAGYAWEMYRNRKIDDNKFGIDRQPAALGLKIDSLFGAWFIRGQLIRDFVALNNFEHAPYLVRFENGENWDDFRLISARDSELTEEDLFLLDTIAECCIAPDENLPKITKIFEENKELFL